MGLGPNLWNKQYKTLFMSCSQFKYLYYKAQNRGHDNKLQKLTLA